MSATGPTATDSGTKAEKSLGAVAARGVAWLMVGSFVARGSGFVTQIVLAALLLPSEFGRVGLALTVSQVVTTLVAFGIDDIILQRQRASRFWLRSAVWTSATLGILSLLAIAIAAPIGAAIYGQPDLVGLIWVQALAIPIGALTAVPLAILRETLAFRFLALFTTFETVAIQIATVLLALAGAGAFSFVVPVPLLAFVKLVVFWARTRPRIGSNRRHPRMIRHIVQSGTTISLNRILIELVGQGHVIVLGLLAAPHTVGLFVFAFRLAVMPVRTLASAFNNVMLPALARLGQEPERQARAAVDAARLLSFVVFPACFLQAALAEPLLRLLFGSKWDGAIPAAQILSVGLPFDAISWLAGSLLSARGEFGRALFYAAVSTVFFFALMIVGGWVEPLLGIATAVSLYYAIAPTLMSILVLRSRETPAGNILGLYAGPLLYSTIAMGTAYAASLAGPWAENLVARVILIVLVGGLLYVVLVRLFAPGVLRRLVEQAPTRIALPMRRVARLAA